MSDKPIKIGSIGKGDGGLRTGRAYYQGIAKQSPEILDFGFVSKSIFIDNYGDHELFFTLKNSEQAESKWEDKIHGSLKPKESRLFQHRNEHFIKVLTEENETKYKVEAW